MFCFRCGNELPPKVVNCPACDTPQKRRQRRRQRLFLGLFIFLAGAFFGSLVDSYLFKGKTWDATFFAFFQKMGSESVKPAPGADSQVASVPSVMQMTIHDLAAMAPATAGDQRMPQSVSVPKGAVPPGGAPVPGGQRKPGVPTDPAVPTGVPQSPLPDNTSGVLGLQGEIVLATDPKQLEALLKQVAASDSVVQATVSAPVPATGLEVPTVDKPLPPTILAAFQEDDTLAVEKVVPLEESPGTNFHGSLSADGNVLVFASNRAARPAEGGGGKLQCYMKDLAAAAPAVRLFPWEGNVWTPEFARDGASLVFSSDSEEKEHIYIQDRVTQQIRQITSGKHKNTNPALSPDGAYVAFHSNRKGNNDIWLVSVKGEGLVQVTSGPDDDREPRWTPDGKAILFTRIKERFKVSHILKVPVDPVGNPEPLIAGDHRNWLPDLSPDGNFLAYVRSGKPDGSENVLRIRNLKTSADWVLKALKGNDQYRPIWSGDGRSLVFHADRKKDKILYQVWLKKAADS
jgi:hypothetical protein